MEEKEKVQFHGMEMNVQYVHLRIGLMSDHRKCLNCDNLKVETERGFGVHLSMRISEFLSAYHPPEKEYWNSYKSKGLKCTVNE